MSAMSKEQGSTFESDLRRLEEIVKLLGEGEGSLDESLSLFEEGVKLARSSIDKLNSGKQRVQQLVKDNDDLFSLKDFQVE